MNGWYDLKGFNSGLLDKTLSGDGPGRFLNIEIFKGSWEVNFFPIFRVTVNATKKMDEIQS